MHLTISSGVIVDNELPTRLPRPARSRSPRHDDSADAMWHHTLFRPSHPAANLPSSCDEAPESVTNLDITPHHPIARARKQLFCTRFHDRW